MNLNYVLLQLERHQITIFSDTADSEGWRTIEVGCAAPSPPFPLGKVLFYTLVLSPGQNEVPREERDAIRRRLWHRFTDIFGDDEADDLEAGEEDDSLDPSL